MIHGRTHSRGAIVRRNIASMWMCFGAAMCIVYVTNLQGAVGPIDETANTTPTAEQKAGTCGPLFLSESPSPRAGTRQSENFDKMQKDPTPVSVQGERGPSSTAGELKPDHSPPRCGQLTAAYADQISRQESNDDPEVVAPTRLAKIQLEGDDGTSVAECGVGTSCDSEVVAKPNTSAEALKRSAESKKNKARKETATATAIPTRPADLTHWWPDRRSGHLNVLFVGGATFGTALAVLTDGEFKNAANISKGIKVIRADGSPVPGQWVTSVNPELILLKVPPGIYTVEIHPEFRDSKGVEFDEFASGKVFVD